MTRFEKILIRGRRIKINLWQEGLITDNVIKQLQGEPRVIIHPVGQSSSANNDRNVPDLNNIARYLECETLSEDEYISTNLTSAQNHETLPNFEEAVIKINNVDIVEQNLGKMFGDDGGTCIGKPNTKPPPPCNKNKQRKRKKNPEDIRLVLKELFGDSPSDEDDSSVRSGNKPKKIENKRRRTLPVSINLKPLKIIQKRRSYTDADKVNATKQPIQIHSPVVATVLKAIEFETTSSRVKSEKNTEVAHSSIHQSSDYDTMRNVIVVKPVVCEAETQKTVQTEMAEIVDLTLDDSDYPSSIIVESTEKSVKEEILSSNSETALAPAARGASMPILSPVLPAEATQEANLPSETPMLRSFRISDKLFQNLNNQNEATQRPPPAAASQETSSNQSAQNEQNTHSFFSNLQWLETKMRIPPVSTQKTCQQSQLQATLTSTQKAAEHQAKQVNLLKATLQEPVPLQEANKKQHETVSSKPNQQQQITISRQQQEAPSTVQLQTNQISQQRMMPRQQQEESVAVHQQVNRFSHQPQSALKRSLSLHDQMRQDSNKRHHHHLRQQQNNSRQEQSRQQQENAMLQRSNSLQQQQQQSNLVDQRFQRHLGEQQSLPVNLRQNSIRNSQPPPQENLSLLHQLVQNAGPQPVSFQTNQPQVNFAASQFPSQPPQMMRIFAASTDSFTIISNSVCADILLLQLYTYCEWSKNVSIFRETACGLLRDLVFKPSSLVFGKYCDQVRLEFGNKIIRDLLPFDVERLDISEIFTAASRKLIESGHQIGIYFALGIVSYLIKPCQAICTTPFTKKFYNHIATISANLEARSRSRSQNVFVWNIANLKQLETQIQQYHHISNWLQAELGKSSSNGETSKKKDSSLNQMLQETILKTTKQHQTNNTTTVPSSAIQTVPSIQVQSHIVIPPSGQVKPRQVPSQQTPNLTQSPVVNVPSTQQQPNTTNTENENNSQEINVYAEPLPSVLPPSEEPDTTTDDDVVDLTWIDDGDDDEIAEEIKDCKAFLFKVETDEEKNSLPVGEVRSISPDSGCGSPHLQHDDPGQSQEYWCLCGKKAIFICRCKISMYCSSECQNKDWRDHQNLCKRIQGSKE